MHAFGPMANNAKHPMKREKYQIEEKLLPTRGLNVKGIFVGLPTPPHMTGEDGNVRTIESRSFPSHRGNLTAKSPSKRSFAAGKPALVINRLATSRDD